MSETDDTDDLLLIPPDFFLIDSALEHPFYNQNNFGPYYDIVESLITQVVGLEDRLHCIESVSDISLVSSSLDRSFESHNNHKQNRMSSFRKYNSTDNLYQSLSTQSTPQKPHNTKYKLKSLPASPNVNRYSPKKASVSHRELNKTPRKVDVQNRANSEGVGMLSEIDNFLSKVKTIQRINTARNLEVDFNNINRNKPQESNEVEEILHEMDQQQQKNETRIKLTEDEVYRKKEPVFIRENTWRCGDNFESIPDYGAGIKHRFYDPLGNNQENFNKVLRRNPQPTAFSTDESPQNTSFNTVLEQNSSGSSSSSSTQTTAYNKFKYGPNEDRNDLLNSPLHSNALNVLNMHKKLLDESNSGDERVATKNKYKDNHLPKSINSVSNNLGLMSLADIWATNSQSPHSNSSKISQRLQEEKLRRQHCEQLIQELQTRNLELQQKLAVAVKVDESKNNTIHKFQDALDKVATKLESVNREKASREQELSKILQKNSNDLEDATHKVAYYENEASKALNLAHGNQEKLNNLEKRCSDLTGELKNIELKFSDLQEHYQKEIERSKQLSEILSQKEIELNESKLILSSARQEVGQSKRAVEVCQAEFTSMKNEYAKLQSDLHEEKNQIISLNEQKRRLLNEIDSLRNNEKNLQGKVNKTKDEIESNKLELRNFYQGQVEILVQNKLKEFQGQLDEAQNSFKEEVKKREMSIAKTAAFHIQKISEKCTLEIKLLEEKNQEEKRLCNIQVMQYKQQVESLQGKLEHIQAKRVHIAEQLQKIMESQWSEALKIISSGKSPTFHSQEPFSTIDQLNSLKTKSYSNLEEVFSRELLEDATNVDNNLKYARKKNDSHLSPRGDCISGLIEEEKNERGYAMETPVSSRNHGKSDAEVQKYIQLLLNRQPGHPTVDGTLHHNEGEKVANNDRLWQQPDQENTNKINAKVFHPDRRLEKPPWK